jgi:hypothetical protein
MGVGGVSGVIVVTGEQNSFWPVSLLVANTRQGSCHPNPSQIGAKPNKVTWLVQKNILFIYQYITLVKRGWGKKWEMGKCTYARRSRWQGKCRHGAASTQEEAALTVAVTQGQGCICRDSTSAGGQRQENGLAHVRGGKLDNVERKCKLQP